MLESEFLAATEQADGGAEGAVASLSLEEVPYDRDLRCCCRGVLSVGGMAATTRIAVALYVVYLFVLFFGDAGRQSSLCWRWVVVCDLSNDIGMSWSSSLCGSFYGRWLLVGGITAASDDTATTLRHCKRHCSFRHYQGTQLT